MEEIGDEIDTGLCVYMFYVVYWSPTGMRESREKVIMGVCNTGRVRMVRWGPEEREEEEWHVVM